MQEKKRKQAETERKRAEVRARLEEASKAKKAKKGFMTPDRKKKLRVSFRTILYSFFLFEFWRVLPKSRDILFKTPHACGEFHEALVVFYSFVTKYDATSRYFHALSLQTTRRAFNKDLG